MTDESGQLARIEANIAHISEQLAELRPLLLARSGDVTRMQVFKADLDGVGAKVRALESRVGVIENRGARDAGIAVGAFAVMQVLWTIGREALGLLFHGAAK